MFVRKCSVVFATVASMVPVAGAIAQETTTYTYDARGRVVAVSKSGGTNNGVHVDYTYDDAGNRTNVTVTNAPNGNGDPNAGASVPPGTPRYVVVPLNGYTLIRIN